MEAARIFRQRAVEVGAVDNSEQRRQKARHARAGHIAGDERKGAARRDRHGEDRGQLDVFEKGVDRAAGRHVEVLDIRGAAALEELAPEDAEEGRPAHGDEHRAVDRNRLRAAGIKIGRRADAVGRQRHRADDIEADHQADADRKEQHVAFRKRGERPPERGRQRAERQRDPVADEQKRQRRGDRRDHEHADEQIQPVRNLRAGKVVGQLFELLSKIGKQLVKAAAERVLHAVPAGAHQPDQQRQRNGENQITHIADLGRVRITEGRTEIIKIRALGRNGIIGEVGEIDRQRQHGRNGRRPGDFIGRHERHDDEEKVGGPEQDEPQPRLVGRLGGAEHVIEAEDVLQKEEQAGAQRAEQDDHERHRRARIDPLLAVAV